MTKHTKTRLGSAALLTVLAPAAVAGTQPFFNPLTQSSAVASPNHVNELHSPWQAPAGMSQTNVLSLREVEADQQQSIQRVPAGTQSSMFDMLAYDPSGRYLFIPHETPFGAGLSRYDTVQDRTDLLFAGDAEAGVTDVCDADALAAGTADACPAWDFDYAAFDPARWTPNGTVLLGEEWSGLGRLVEVMHPLGPAPAHPLASALTAGKDYRVLESIANVAHEGINFSLRFPNRVLYYIDEWNSGSIYALVLRRPGDYAAGGQTFVLAVHAFDDTGGDPAALWNDPVNANAQRFGRALWKPITDAHGNPLRGVTNPFRDGPTNDPRTNEDTRGGRMAADDVGGTPYGRPEDMEVGILPNFNEVLYVTATSEHAILSIEMLGNRRAIVRQFASRDTPRNLGFPATTGLLDSPDNLAQDALGNLYVIEDSPNQGDIGGDVWFARDTDQDGVAESLDHFLSLQVAGSEATGMVFHPTYAATFAIAVQHPASTDLATVPEGLGDAVWEFDLAGVVPPPCVPEAADEGLFDSWEAAEATTCTPMDSDRSFLGLLEAAKRRGVGAARQTPPISTW